MMGGTHLVIGLAAGVLSGGGIPGAGAAVAGALLPDIDAPGSTVGRIINPLHFGRIGHAVLGLGLAYAAQRFSAPALLLPAAFYLVLAFLPHRQITHSLLGLVIAVGAVTAMFPRLWIPFAVGYASHLLADSLTPSEIPLFWPWQHRIGLGLVQTGGALDWLLQAAGWLFLLGQLPKLF